MIAQRIRRGNQNQSNDGSESNKTDGSEQAAPSQQSNNLEQSIQSEQSNSDSKQTQPEPDANRAPSAQAESLESVPGQQLIPEPVVQTDQNIESQPVSPGTDLQEPQAQDSTPLNVNSNRQTGKNKIQAKGKDAKDLLKEGKTKASPSTAQTKQAPLATVDKKSKQKTAPSLSNYRPKVETLSNLQSKFVRVLFATTRLNEGTLKAPIYGTNRHLDLGTGSLEFGTASIMKPPALQRPATAKSGAEYRELLKSGSSLWLQAPVSKPSTMSEDDFFRRIKQWPYKICIYIHGYYKPFNVSLQDASMLFAEYQHFEGMDENKILPIVFSWPSFEGKSRYSVDEANIEWSSKPFEQFMNRLLKEKNPEASIDMVAHSLGARLALSYLSQDHADIAKPWLRNLFLCSADVDLHSTEAMIPTLEDAVSNSIYVFVSDRDMPLVMSQYLHGQPRLGRPIDPPRGSDGGQSKSVIDEIGGEFFRQLTKDTANLLTGQGSTDTPQVKKWLQQNPNLDRELGTKTRFLDVTDLVASNMGHGLPWSVLAGMMANQAKFPHLRIYPVHKTPDRTILQQGFGQPRVLYRFTRMDPR